MKEETRRAALYVRVSTEAQWEEGYSVDAQKEMLIAYCRARALSDYELYVDGGWSGSSLERPAMRRLIGDAAAGRISCVIVYKLDRLSRSQKDTLYLIEDVFNPNGVAFVSLNENMDTATPIGRAMLGIMSAFAQLERETIRERTRMGMRERVKQGYWMGGGKVPFGYDYDPVQGILVPNADAPTVRQVYRMYLDGRSPAEIARTLGLGYERLVRQILLRKTNAGYICYGGEEYRGRHQPLVDEKTFQAAVEMFRKRSRMALKSADNLLTGLVVCGVCGAKMRYQKWGKSGYKIYCYSQDKGKPHLHRSDHCDNVKIWAYELEDLVTGDLFAMARRRVTGEDGAEELPDETKIRETRLAAAERKLRRLYRLYAAAEDEILRDAIREAQEECDEARRYWEEARRAAAERGQERAQYGELATMEEVWPYMTRREKQNVFRQYIDRIVVTYDRVDVYYSIPPASEKK